MAQFEITSTFMVSAGASCVFLSKKIKIFHPVWPPRVFAEFFPNLEFEIRTQSSVRRTIFTHMGRESAHGRPFVRRVAGCNPYRDYVYLGWCSVVRMKLFTSRHIGRRRAVVTCSNRDTPAIHSLCSLLLDINWFKGDHETAPFRRVVLI